MPRFWVRASATNEQARKILSEMKDRMDAYRRMLVRRAAEHAHEIVLSKLPDTDDYDDLRELLTVRDIAGLTAGLEAATAVVGKTTGARRQVSDLPGDKTLLIVGQPRRGLPSPPEEIFILRRFNPWTKDTIPIVPSDRTAKLSFRVVSEQEAARVRAQRRANIPEVTALLARAGIRLSEADRERVSEALATKEASQDLAFLSLRTEFGLQNAPNAPHWRPAVRSVRGDFLRDFLGNPEMQRFLVDPEFEGWRASPPGIRTITIRRAEKLREFQDKITGG